MDALIIIVAVVAYIFGGTFTVGLLTADRDDAFWTFVFWPGVLFALALFGTFGMVGYAGHWLGVFIRERF